MLLCYREYITLSADQSLLATCKMLKRIDQSSATWRESTVCLSDVPTGHLGAAVAEVVTHGQCAMHSAYGIREGGFCGGLLRVHAGTAGADRWLPLKFVSAGSELGTLPCNTALGSGCCLSYL